MGRRCIDPAALCAQANYLIVSQWCNPFILYDSYTHACIVTQLQIEDMVALFPTMPYSLKVKTFSGVEAS